MRFILRSIFWLVVAFVVIRPGFDLDAAGQTAGQALAAGQTAIATQLEQTQCDTLQCAGGKALLAAALTHPAPTSIQPMQDDAHPESAPFPRPRPDWLG